MAKTHVALVNEVEEQLEDSSNGLWSATVVANALDQATRELSSYDPYMFLITREFESRTGFETAGTAGSLTDTTESQFLATDVGKVVFNLTDNTWAIVVTYTSSSVLVLSRDIMDEDEQYAMYHQDCWGPKQIYMGDIGDYVGPNYGVDSVYYPAQGSRRTKRNFTLDQGVLTVLYDGNVPDSTLGTNINRRSRIVDVDIWMKRQHKVSRMTDQAGVVDLSAGYDRGATSIVIDALEDDDVITVGQEFYISPATTSQVTNAGLRGRYTCTESVTVASNEAIVKFWPPLENDVSDNWLVTFVRSTLTPEQERVVVDLTVGRLAITKAALYLQQISAAIASVSSGSTALGLVAAKVLLQVTDVASARTAADLMPAIILEANTEIDLMAAKILRQVSDIDDARTAADLMDELLIEMNAETDKMSAALGQAATALTAGGASINRVNQGGPNVPGQFAAEAAQYVSIAQGRAETAQAFLAQVNGSLSNARAQIETGAAELTSAGGSGGVAQAFLAQVESDLGQVRAQLETGVGELSGAQASVNEALGWLEKAAVEIQVGTAAREMRIWGQNKAEQAIKDMRRSLLPKQRRTYSRV